LSGLIFINKSSKDRGIGKMNAEMKKLKREKIKLFMFPEGFRNHSSEIVEFKKGAFYLAVQAQVPIIPVVFSSYNTFLRPSERVFDSGEIIIQALPEISTEGLSSSDVNKLMEQTRTIMIKKFEELNHEIKLRAQYKSNNFY
jgi:lysophosphatidate acyltransferase